MRPAPSYVRTVLFLIMAVLIGVLYVTLPPLRLKLYGEAVATVPAPISTLAPAPTLPPTSTPTPTPDIALSLSGAQIMRGGQPVTLVGAARYSLEFECHGDGHFQLSDFQAMRTWGMNTVRIPLSSAFWRNLDGKCPDYQATVAEAVASAEHAGLYVILDIQRDAPFSLAQDAIDGGSQCPLPDQLREHLVAVVEETMQPAHVSLWVRPTQHDGERSAWGAHPLSSRHTEEPVNE